MFKNPNNRIRSKKKHRIKIWRITFVKMTIIFVGHSLFVFCFSWLRLNFFWFISMINREKFYLCQMLTCAHFRQAIIFIMFRYRIHTRTLLLIYCYTEWNYFHIYGSIDCIKLPSISYYAVFSLFFRISFFFWFSIFLLYITFDFIKTITVASGYFSGKHFIWCIFSYNYSNNCWNLQCNVPSVQTLGRTLLYSNISYLMSFHFTFIQSLFISLSLDEIFSIFNYN